VQTRRAWQLIGFLWVAFFLNYCDRQFVFSIFPLLKSDLGFTNVQLGLTGSIFLWVYGLCSPVAGQLGDRGSQRWLIASSLVLWSAVTVLTGLAGSPAGLLLGRGLMGVTEALFVPPAIALIGASLAPTVRSRAISAFFSAQLCGVVAGGWLGGWIAQHFGWRQAFFVLGSAGIIFAVPLALFLRSVPEPARAPAHAAPRVAAAALARVPLFVSLCACFPAFTLLMWVLYAWLPALLYERFSLDLAQAGFMATAYLQGATLVGLVAGGALSDRLYRRAKAARFWMLAAAMLFGAPWVHLLGHADTLAAAKMGAAGFGLGSGVLIANLMVSPFDVVPAGARASAVAVINTIGPPFSGLATLLSGVWKDRVGIPNLMSGAALLSMLAGVALLLATRRWFDRDFQKVNS
jgi:MFS family permease